MTRRVGGAAAVRLLYDGVINSHYRFVWGGEGARCVSERGEPPTARGCGAVVRPTGG